MVYGDPAAPLHEVITKEALSSDTTRFLNSELTAVSTTNITSEGDIRKYDYVSLNAIDSRPTRKLYPKSRS